MREQKNNPVPLSLWGAGNHPVCLFFMMYLCCLFPQIEFMFFTGMKRVNRTFLLILTGLLAAVSHVSAQSPDTALIQKRLASLHSSIPLKLTYEARMYIGQMLSNENNKTGDAVSAANDYLPYVKSVITRKKAPAMLAYLPYVMTGYVNERNASDGKVGIWGMPYAVARKYDLVLNSFIDERYDAVTSTESAIDYLFDLKHDFSDWNLAILAFGTSPTNVLQHLYKAGNTKTYEAIYNDLNESEKRFVGQFVAASYIFSFYNEADIRISVRPATPAPATDTLDIFRKLTFDKIASGTGLTVSIIRQLNPVYKLDVIPYNEAPHTLILPKGYKATFDSIFQNYPNLEAVKPSNDTPVILHDSDIAKPAVKPAAVKKVAVYYKVKSGDNMYGVADLFDCTIYQLKAWNKLKKNYLIAGQTLAFYVPASNKARYQKINTMTLQQKKVLMYSD